MSQSNGSGFFLVKKENIYSRLNEIIVNTNETHIDVTQEFLRCYHIHLDPLGVIQYIRSKLVNNEVQHRDMVEKLLLQWVDMFPEDFAGETTRVELLIDLLCYLESSHTEVYKEKLSTILEQDPLFLANRASMSTFDAISKYGAAELSKAISHHCRYLFEEIAADAFDNDNWKRSYKTPPNALRRYTEAVANWTASTIISKPNRKTQAAGLALFCELLFVCIFLNFTVLYAILKGMNKISIQRLASVWKTVPSKYVENYELVDNLFLPANNFQAYRQKLERCVTSSKPVFPCYEIFLMDIEQERYKSEVVTQVKAMFPFRDERNETLEAFVMHLPCFDDKELIDLSLRNYKPNLDEAQSFISGANSFLFSYDKITPTGNSTVSSTNSEWEIDTYLETPNPVTTKKKEKRSLLSAFFSSNKNENTILGGGLYGSGTPNPVLKVGSVNKYGYTLLCLYSDLKPEKGMRIKIGKKIRVAVFLVNDVVYAMDDKCSHQDVPLYPGDIEEFHGEPNVLCPGHGLKFSLITGICNVKRYKQQVYKTKIKSDLVWAKI